MFDNYFVVATLSATLVFAVGCGDDGGGAEDASVTTFDAVVSDPDSAAPDAAPQAAGPVANLTSTYSGPCDQVDLAWTNPADAAYASVLVIRQVGGAVADVPADGTAYVADEVLPNGGVVVFVGDAESFQDTSAFNHGDSVSYAVFTTTAANIYGTSVASGITVDQALGVQVGKFSVSLTDNVVTVTSPANFVSTGTAVFDALTSTLTLDVGITNGACRAVHNAKLVATTINEGTAVAEGDTVFEGLETLYFGPQALADTAIGTSQFTFTNVSGAVDPFEVDFEIVDHATLLVGGGYDNAAFAIDTSGAVQSAPINMQALSFITNSDSTVYQGAISPNGELAYLGHGQQPMLVMVDLTTFTAVGSTDLTGANNILNDGTGSLGYVASVTMSPNGQYLYAVLVTNEHRAYFCSAASESDCDMLGRITLGATTADVELVRLDRDTLVEVDRLNLLTASTVRPRAGLMSMSADGGLGAIPIRREGKIFLVNLDTMTLVDGDAATGGDQPFDVSASSTEPHLVALSADGTQMAVAYRGNGRDGPDHDDALDLIDVATGTTTQLAMTTTSATLDNKSGSLSFGPDGRLYYGRKNGTVGLSIFDLVASTELELLADDEIYGVTFSPDGARYYVWNEAPGELTVFGTADDISIPLAADGSDPGVFDIDFGHMGLITPL